MRFQNYQSFLEKITGMNKHFFFTDDLQVLGKVEGELVFEDIYLSSLLRGHCRNGVFRNFIYLFETIIM